MSALVSLQESIDRAREEMQRGNIVDSIIEQMETELKAEVGEVGAQKLIDTYSSLNELKNNNPSIINLALKKQSEAEIEAYVANELRLEKECAEIQASLEKIKATKKDEHTISMQDILEDIHELIPHDKIMNSANLSLPELEQLYQDQIEERRRKIEEQKTFYREGEEEDDDDDDENYIPLHNDHEDEKMEAGSQITESTAAQRRRKNKKKNNRRNRALKKENKILETFNADLTEAELKFEKELAKESEREYKSYLKRIQQKPDSADAKIAQKIQEYTQYKYSDWPLDYFGINPQTKASLLKEAMAMNELSGKYQYNIYRHADIAVEFMTPIRLMSAPEGPFLFPVPAHAVPGIFVLAVLGGAILYLEQHFSKTESGVFIRSCKTEEQILANRERIKARNNLVNERKDFKKQQMYELQFDQLDAALIETFPPLTQFHILETRSLLNTALQVLRKNTVNILQSMRHCLERMYDGGEVIQESTKKKLNLGEALTRTYEKLVQRQTEANAGVKKSQEDEINSRIQISIKSDHIKRWINEHEVYLFKMMLIINRYKAFVQNIHLVNRDPMKLKTVTDNFKLTEQQMLQGGSSIESDMFRRIIRIPSCELTTEFKVIHVSQLEPENVKSYQEIRAIVFTMVERFHEKHNDANTALKEILGTNMPGVTRENKRTREDEDEEVKKPDDLEMNVDDEYDPAKIVSADVLQKSRDLQLKTKQKAPLLSEIESFNQRYLKHVLQPRLQKDFAIVKEEFDRLHVPVPTKAEVEALDKQEAELAEKKKEFYERERAALMQDLDDIMEEEGPELEAIPENLVGENFLMDNNNDMETSKEEGEKEEEMQV